MNTPNPADGAAESGAGRLRPSPVREVLVQAPVLTTIRQRVVPRRCRESLKGFWRARVEPPRLTPSLEARLREVFDADLAQLGSWLGVPLDCENFHEVTVGRAHEWAGLQADGSAGRRAERVDRDELGPDQLLAGLEPLAEPGGDRLVARRVVRRRRGDGALPPRVEGSPSAANGSTPWR